VTAGAPARDPVRPPSEGDPLGLALRLSLVYLLLNPGLRWPERTATTGVAVAGLLFPSLARRPALWALATAAVAWRLVDLWPGSDNHDYLLAWWCLALACCLSVPERERALARSARLLVGLAFGFATLWKLVLSPDFADGTFFRTALLLDGRFAGLAGLAGGMTPELFARNERALEAFAAGLATPGLVEPARLVRLAMLLTGATLAGEAWLAVSCLWPRDGRLRRSRHAALLVFCATAYAVAPVATFGWLLVVLGLAQCEPGRRRTRALYLAAFALVFLYAALPWGDFVG
jgi:hypothetical protein